MTKKNEYLKQLLYLYDEGALNNDGTHMLISELKKELVKNGR